MSDPTNQTALGLGDTNVDPDILTKEIDHNFFDDPTEGEEVESITCQVDPKEKEVKILNKMPNENHEDAKKSQQTSEPDCSSSSNNKAVLMRLKPEDEADVEDDGYHVDSGRSSSNVTIHLELGKDGKVQDGDSGAVSEDFYSMQSNANYPRPKESYQLQQRRRSFGTIPQPQRNGQSGASSKGEEAFQPMNLTDCGLNGHFGDCTSSDSSGSSSSSAKGGDESDSDLSDSSESELESLDTDDEEFVDMLEKYFDYIDPDSDCSDLTEVSPLSSLAASPLPPSYFVGLDANGGELYHPQIPNEHTLDNLNIVSDDQLCLATGALTIGEVEGRNDGMVSREEGRYPTTAEIDVAAAAVTAVASAVPVAAQLLERDLLRGGKPRLPVVISTTETVIIPADESDDDNNAPGSMSISVAGTCGTSIDIDDVADVDNDPPPEEGSGEFGERDPAKNKKELDVCFNCCVMEHAKKILSREASPSRKHNGWLTQAKQLEEGNGNSGGNGNNGDEIGRAMQHGGGSRGRLMWNGKQRAGSSTSATSSSSSTTGSSSTNTLSSGASGGSGGMRKSQKNFTFTPEQMRKIERENHILLRKILDTHTKGFHHGHHGNHCHHHRCKNSGHHHHNGHHPNKMASSSVSIARLRQQKRIEHDNAILMKKLQSVKPSKEIGDAFGKAVKN